jgi:hypothetical protein
MLKWLILSPLSAIIPPRFAQAYEELSLAEVFSCYLCLGTIAQKQDLAEAKRELALHCPFINRFYAAALGEWNERLGKLKSDGAEAFYKKVFCHYRFQQGMFDALLPQKASTGADTG